MTEQKTRICPTCGESFKVPRTRPTQQYCCMSCSVEGRQAAKLNQSGQRVEEFINSLENLEILDALEGHFTRKNTTDNNITAKGARTHNRPGVKFIVLAVEDRQAGE